MYICTCVHTRRVVAALLVTLTPRINIPYAPPVRGFADCRCRPPRGNVLDPPETPGKDKETETSFAAGSISFVNRTMPDPAVLRLPWRIRFHKADQRFYVTPLGGTCLLARERFHACRNSRKICSSFGRSASLGKGKVSKRSLRKLCSPWKRTSRFDDPAESVC